MSAWVPDEWEFLGFFFFGGRNSARGHQDRRYSALEKLGTQVRQNSFQPSVHVEGFVLWAKAEFLARGRHGEHGLTLSCLARRKDV